MISSFCNLAGGGAGEIGYKDVHRARIVGYGIDAKSRKCNEVKLAGGTRVRGAPGSFATLHFRLLYQRSSFFLTRLLNIHLGGFRGNETPFADQTSRGNAEENTCPCADNADDCVGFYLCSNILGKRECFRKIIGCNASQCDCHDTHEDKNKAASEQMGCKVKMPEFQIGNLRCPDYSVSIFCS